MGKHSIVKVAHIVQCFGKSYMLEGRMKVKK